MRYNVGYLHDWANRIRQKVHEHNYILKLLKQSSWLFLQSGDICVTEAGNTIHAVNNMFPSLYFALRILLEAPIVPHAPQIFLRTSATRTGFLPATLDLNQISPTPHHQFHGIYMKYLGYLLRSVNIVIISLDHPNLLPSWNEAVFNDFYLTNEWFENCYWALMNCLWDGSTLSGTAIFLSTTFPFSYRQASFSVEACEPIALNASVLCSMWPPKPNESCVISSNSSSHLGSRWAPRLPRCCQQVFGILEQNGNCVEH